MAPRRGARVVKVEQAVDYDNLTVKEVLCPICRSILIEPVTLPCNHVFCSSCFQGTMENANLVCPLCRVRIGSWLRTCKKDNKLINIDYWNAIKKLFPVQIKNKLDGIEENLDYEDPLIQFAKPGELKKEYETQMKKETESFKREREAEIKASEALIQKLSEEEEYQKIIEEEKLRLDEEIARKLAEELNTVESMKSGEVPCSQMKLSNINNSKKSGPLDRFLRNESIKNSKQSTPPKKEREKKIDYATKDYTCRILCHDIGNDWETMGKSSEEDYGPLTLSMLNQKISLELQDVLDLGNNSDSSDSIESECRYFKPIDYRRSLPCRKTIPIRVPAVRGEVKTNNRSAPKGQNMLKNDPLNSAFAVFGKLSLGDQGEKSSTSYQMTKVRSVSTEKSQMRSPEKNKKNLSPGKKNKNNFKQTDEPKELTTRQKVNQNKNGTLNKANVSVKRKLANDPLVHVSPNKRNKLELSFTRFLDSPSSPFRGFGKIESEVKLPHKRFTRNNKIEDLSMDNFIDSDKVKLQVKSDYELAKKLQEHFNSSSYSTRSSAPRRGKKVTRQATLDSMFSKH